MWNDLNCDSKGTVFMTTSLVRSIERISSNKFVWRLDTVCTNCELMMNHWRHSWKRGKSKMMRKTMRRKKKEGCGEGMSRRNGKKKSQEKSSVERLPREWQYFHDFSRISNYILAQDYCFFDIVSLTVMLRLFSWERMLIPRESPNSRLCASMHACIVAT